MATIRKRGGKYEVQIRRLGLRQISRTFNVLGDARTWARQMEVRADRKDLPPDGRVLRKLTLGQLVIRYRDTVSVAKRTWDRERYFRTAFSKHPICHKQIADVRPADFASYCNERLRQIKASSLKRQLAPIHNLFEIARDQWDLPITDNPLGKLQLKAADRRRERRLKPGEQKLILKAAAGCLNPRPDNSFRAGNWHAQRRDTCRPMPSYRSGRPRSANTRNKERTSPDDTSDEEGDSNPA